MHKIESLHKKCYKVGIYNKVSSFEGFFMGKNTNRMTRRTDVPEHPDDAKYRLHMQDLWEKSRQKSLSRHTLPFHKKPKKRSIAHDGSPWIEDKNVFKAVSFARQMLKDDDLSIEICMYKAAKYYKVQLPDVAKAMGHFANFIKKKKSEY